METVFFSIVVVSLNPGKRLEQTIQSICKQNRDDIQVVIKDGMSTDGSIEAFIEKGYLKKYPWISLVQKSDRSIYDGMNQAVTLTKGKYLLFLNCGDLFYNEEVLEMMKHAMVEAEGRTALAALSAKEKDHITQEEHVKNNPIIFYGNQYNEVQSTVVYSAPKIDDFTCYRNVPCHQVCFYDSRLFEKRGYDLTYKVRADYEHFLNAIYVEKATAIYVPHIIARYEGGGFSETVENRKQSAKEHKAITLEYLGKKKVLKYSMIMMLTLAPIRTKIAESPKLANIYNIVKTKIYQWIR